MSNANVTALLTAAAAEIASRVGHGRILRSTLATGVVRVTVHLDADDTRSRLIAEHAVASRLAAAGVRHTIACF